MPTPKNERLDLVITGDSRIIDRFVAVIDSLLAIGRKQNLVGYRMKIRPFQGDPSDDEIDDTPFQDPPAETTQGETTSSYENNAK